MSPPKKPGAADAEPWLVFRICECPVCRGVAIGPCELRGGWFWGPGHKLAGERPYWATRRAAEWRASKATDVHGCDWSSQPDLHITCGAPWTVPSWKQPKDLPEGIYLTDDGRYYTFDDEKITCPDCLHRPVLESGTW